VTKNYGERVAVAGVDFDVDPGICFGFLGPNGAGKTTT
jgi:lipooligosaccharide transport system ATP-binding protein